MISDIILKHSLLIAISLVINSCSKTHDKILPKQKNITESVYASVTIQPDSLYQAYAIVAGILDKNLIEEGDTVSKEQDIIQINNSSPKLNTQNAKFALALTKENYNGNAAVLRTIEDEINAATLKYKNDSINYFRQKNLWNKQIGSKVAFDTKKLNYELSENNLQLLQNKYNRTKNELVTAVKQAQNKYQATLLTTKDFTIKSKINGKVYALFKEPGEIVTTLQPLAAIGSKNTFVIKMLVDEVDIVRILVNQKIIISLDAYKRAVFTGKVAKIYPKKDERNQTFMVEAFFDKAPEKLYPGLSGEANIIIATKENSLIIPKEYLIGNNKVKTENGIVTITTGLKDLEFVEIIDGITKDTYIYKPE